MPTKAQLEKAIAKLEKLRKDASEAVVRDFDERLLMSWIYHDNALDGSVYTAHELQVAIHDQVVSDTSLIPVYDEIRQYKNAVDFVKSMIEKKRLTLNLELLHKIHAALDPGEDEGKGEPKYRKDMPLHRLYFHEISQPEKIENEMNEALQWLSAPDTKRNTHVLRLAAKIQFQLLHIFPYATYSGQAARLFSNLILMRAGYPPCIIHATDRQRYYEALKTSDGALARLLGESLYASLQSAERFFKEQAKPGIQNA
ncbi:MAG: Fic family protein [Myxococcales bacterium]|nr:MAG: Fic family protein [Myxococcales bacterium]